MSGESIDIALKWVDSLIYGPEKGFEDDEKESK